MRREFHVRFCEGAGVKSPRATRRNVYVRSRRAGERVMQGLRRLYAGLRLRINETKSAVLLARKGKFLGYGFYISRKREVRLGASPAAMEAMKDRVREITARSRGWSMKAVVGELRSYLIGWRQYFRLAYTPRVFRRLDGWIRRRLRALQLKQWKRGRTAYRELRKLGVSDFWSRMVASSIQRMYWTAHTHAQVALPNSHFDQLGVPHLAP